MLRYKGMSLKHATAIMDQLFELKLVRKEQFLLNTEEDVNEYYDNLFNERLW
jgi:hypothetical protein